MWLIKIFLWWPLILFEYILKLFCMYVLYTFLLELLFVKYKITCKHKLSVCACTCVFLWIRHSEIPFYNLLHGSGSFITGWPRCEPGVFRCRFAVLRWWSREKGSCRKGLTQLAMFVGLWSQSSWGSPVFSIWCLVGNGRMTHNHYYNNHHQSSHSLPSTGKFLRPIGFMTGWNIWKDGYKWVCKLCEYYSYILRKPKVNQVMCINLFRNSPSRCMTTIFWVQQTVVCVLMPGFV